MSAQIFPNEEQILDILLAELPQGVYANDRADDADTAKRSVSSSELRTLARQLATLYENLDDINQNKSITNVNVNGIDRWEKMLFKDQQDATLPFLDRVNKLLAKRRYQASLSLPNIRAQVAAILDPLGVEFDILPYSGAWNGDKNGAWILGESQLGLDTFLAKRDPLTGANQDLVPLDCDLDYAAAGLEEQDLLDIQETAYKYEVRIYGTVDDAVVDRIDVLLTEIEPARSDHRIVNGDPGPVDPTDYLLTEDGDHLVTEDGDNIIL